MMGTDGICYIVGAGDFAQARFSPAQGDFIIACDAGLLAVRGAGFEPDIILGDFDSLGFVPEGGNVVRHPVHKDDTDSLLALQTGLERGYTRFILHGCTGGRLDHTLANIQTAAYAAECGSQCFIFGSGYTLTVINNSALRFSADCAGTISVFAHGGDACGVYLSGLEYPLCDARLVCSRPLGVSNAFTGVPAEVRVGTGSLTVVWQDGGELALPVIVRNKI